MPMYINASNLLFLFDVVNNAMSRGISQKLLEDRAPNFWVFSQFYYLFAMWPWDRETKKQCSTGIDYFAFHGAFGNDWRHFIVMSAGGRILLVSSADRPGVLLNTHNRQDSKAMTKNCRPHISMVPRERKPWTFGAHLSSPSFRIDTLRQKPRSTKTLET